MIKNKVKLKRENLEKREISEDIDVKSQLFQVTGDIGEDMSQDYTLAHFSQNEKEFISENYENAQFAKNMVRKFADKGYEYKWDEDNYDWKRDVEGAIVKFPLNDNDKKKIHENARKTFNNFMVMPHTLSLLNRNKDSNFMVKLLGKYQEEEPETKFDSQDRSILQKIKNKLSGKDEYEED